MDARDRQLAEEQKKKGGENKPRKTMCGTYDNVKKKKMRKAIM